MPARARPRVIPQTSGPGNPRIVVPQRLAQALDPAGTTREFIPRAAKLTSASTPYSGELFEDEGTRIPVLPAGVSQSVGKLRRPWNYVGYMVDPGDADSDGLTVQLVVWTSTMHAPLPVQAVDFTLGPQAFAPVIMGAIAELIVTNGTEDDIKGLRAALWGMSES
jgi:hypothetical protein